ncbi:MAG: pyrroline-5-carboxylate reductase [Rickettsiales bacterium]|nr:pyrroline-5-carboxylate reductase [Rickettsiales bacterium]
MSDPHLVMLGCGRMGAALLSQWLATGAWKHDVTVVKPTPALPDGLGNHRKIHWVADLESLPAHTLPSVVVLAVKPQTLAETLPLCASLLGNTLPYLTIAAGRRIRFYQEHLGAGVRLVRVMPNTPCFIGMGMTALHASATASESDTDLAEALMRAVGETTWLSSEDSMDIATAISGSGPAYVFYFMECLISAAIEMGLDEQTSRLLVVQTLHGSSELAYLTGEPLAKLRQDVSSPGGTTEAALSHLMHPSGQLRLMYDAVQAALQKAREIAASAQ